MADKSIGDLPKAAALYDTDRMVLEQNGEAKSMEGALLKNYIAPYAQTAEQAAEAAESVLEGVREAIEAIPEGAATPIVNDLTTGGTSMALSAEMGKKLKGELDGLTPEDIEAYALQPKSTGKANILSLPPGRYSREGITTQEEATAEGFPVVDWHYEIIIYANENKTSTTDYYKTVEVHTSYGQIWYNILAWNAWIGWRRIASTDYAVNKAGDTMSGELFVNGGYGRLGANNTSVGISHRPTIGNAANYAWIGVSGTNGLSNAAQLLKCENGVEKYYPILHIGNKPSGSYTGNGSSAYRSVTLGGIGRLCLITRSGNYWALVSARGAIISNGSSVIAVNNTIFDGTCNLQLNTSHAALNENGITYTYQVL